MSEIEKHEPHSWGNFLDFYVEPEGDWSPCPKCGLKPRVWLYNNGRSTACGCWTNQYQRFSIYAESIMSVHKRNDGNVSEYDHKELRNNWNHWCETGEFLFERAGKREDGRW